MATLKSPRENVPGMVEKAEKPNRLQFREQGGGRGDSDMGPRPPENARYLWPRMCHARRNKTQGERQCLC